MCNYLSLVDTSTVQKYNFEIQFSNGSMKISGLKITHYTVHVLLNVNHH